MHDHLLDFLRAHLQDGRIEFVERPRPLTGGAFTEVLTFALSIASGPWSGPLVLRLYRAGSSPGQPRLEQAFQDGLTRAGFPAPGVLLAHTEPDVLGRMFIVMQRLPGRSFLRGIRWDEFLRDFPRLLVTWPETVAHLMARLHQVDPSSVLEAGTTVGLDPSTVSTRRHLQFVEHQLAEFGDDGLAEGLEWLQANEPSLPERLSVVHGDLWPGNVLMDGREVTGVVDWDRAAIGDPALDVGFAKAGLALMPAPFPPPPPLRQAVNGAGRSIASRLHRAYERLHPIDSTRVHYFEALRCFAELAVVVEYRAHVSRHREPAGPRAPWDHGVAALTRYFTAVSGVALQMPAKARSRS